MITSTLKATCLASVLALGATLALPAFAGGKKDWRVNTESSSIHFISIKKNSIGEVHHFKTLEGSLNKSGELLVSIDLASVETGIPIRNTRMQEHLFETAQFTTATITADVSGIAYDKLKKGKSINASTPFTLDLHGKQVTLNADVIITKKADKTLSVTTTKPIMLNAQAFGLEGGIQKLMELASLNAIASSIPITVTLNLHIIKK